jgi:hypothetical protein
MKNLILSLSFVLASVFSLSAKETPTLANTYGENVLGLDLSKWNASKVNVKLTDELGQVLLTENFDLGSMKKRLYNLKNLPDGIYSLKVEDDQKIATQAVAITNGVVLADENISYAYKPNLKVIGNTVNINLLSLGNKVTVTILDKENTLVYENEMGEQKIVTKQFNLKNLPSGKYTIIVESGTIMESKEINL